MVTLTSMVSNSGYKIERVSLLSFAVLTRLSTKKTAGALFCCLIYHSRQGMVLINSLPIDCFQLFFNNSFSEGTCFSKYWQELKNKNTKKSNSASMFCFELSNIL
jgi:hypothetical protein